MDQLKSFRRNAELKKFIVSILHIVSIISAKIIKLFYPLAIKTLKLWNLTLLRSKIIYPVPNSTQLDGSLDVIGTGRVKLGEFCRIGKNVVFETRENGSIILGNHVRINQGSVLVAYDEINIGDDCLIGEYCSIRDANHGIEPNELIRIQQHTYSSIKIGNNCWIGRGAVILKGVNVKTGSVVGANSVVTKDLPEQSVSVGSPAKIIRTRK